MSYEEITLDASCKLPAYLVAPVIQKGRGFLRRCCGVAGVLGASARLHVGAENGGYPKGTPLNLGSPADCTPRSNQAGVSLSLGCPYLKLASEWSVYLHCIFHNWGFYNVDIVRITDFNRYHHGNGIK